VLVQEAAANGLCLVYAKADRDLKDILVRDLISSFSENKSSLAGTVSEDTQLFEEGDLPTTDGSVSTYGDILNLASEVGDPSLVYRFMSLASNSAIWSSRAAFGKFGLSEIFSDSSADGYLAQNPKLFPALYRYMFDPNPNVQRSMRSLWQSLVKDPVATLNRHFDLIIEDLLKNILGPEWRTREASCRAIGDLIQDQDIRLYEKHLDDIWKSCSRVMDDIKGSVRLAALQLAKTLSGILVRKVENPDASDEASKMLKHVIPFLLSTSGVESGVKETQGWAVSTLLQIIKKSNRKLISPYVTAILESFIPLFSSMEPDYINYLHLNASGYNLTTQEIDETRLKYSVRYNPLMEGVERLIDNSYGPEIDKQIVSVVEKAAKSSLGMPSQTATSRILVTMFVRNHARFKDFADPLLDAIQKPMLDRNETVGNSYAYAAGYLSRHASDKQVLKTTDFAWKLWSNSDDSRHRSIAAEVFHSISKHATEKFSHLSDKLLPFVFVGKNDDEEDVKETFSKTWSEITGGQRAILLHLNSICQLAVPLLDDPRWILKHASARAIAEAAEAVASLDPLAAAAEAPKIWPALSKALGGRSWDGKERIVDAFGTFFERAKLFLEHDQEVGNEMTKVSTCHCP
jgi:proteasome component ECM29